MKQQTERRYDVPRYEDCSDLLKSLPMGDTRVATTVPVGRCWEGMSGDGRDGTVECTQKDGAPETRDDPEEIDPGNVV